MRITEVRISEWVAEKIQAEHGVFPEEAEEILFSQPSAAPGMAATWRSAWQIAT